MFDSLVIVFPTAHSSGELVIRYDQKEWVLDFSTAAALAESESDAGSSACIKYAAFFSDIEHEILPITPGHRVTITCNLYFKPEDKAGVDRAPNSSTVSAGAIVFKNALSGLLSDVTFMPKGGTIGVGLSFQYPIVAKSGGINRLDKCFKGRDAMIMQVCRELSLKANVRLVYYCSRNPRPRVISRRAVSPSFDFDEADGLSFEKYALECGSDARIVDAGIADYYEEDEEEENCSIKW